MDKAKNRATIPIDSEILDGIRPSALSVDVNNLCNLRCKHCFWDANHTASDPPMNPNILDSVKEVLKRFPSITNILWYGGEPLINRKSVEIIKKGVMLRKNNLIVTNGTFPLETFDNCYHYAVSLDGTKEIHNYLRGETYDLIKKNIKDAIKKKIPTSILYCINALNIECIPSFMEEWASHDLICIPFTVYASMEKKPKELSLDEQHREHIVSLLKNMKKKYGNLISNSELMIELIRPVYSEKLADNCLMNILNPNKKNVLSLHLCNNGEIRVRCALGAYTSCMNCRSVTTLALYAGKIMRDKESLYSLIRMYLSNYYYRKNKVKNEVMKTYNEV